MAHERMTGQRGHDVAAVLLEHLEHAGHVINGVVAQVRLRAVRGDARGMAAPADGALVGDDDVEARRLGDDGRVRNARQQL
jgi:hypothetical protein